MAISETALAPEGTKWRAGAIVRNLALFIGALILIYPLIWLIANSFKPEVYIFSDVGLFGGKFTLDNYIRGWTTLEVSFGRFIVNSAIVSALTVIGTVISCSLAAFCFAILRPRGGQLLFALVLASIMLPLHVIIIPQYIMFSAVGWVGSILPLVVPKFFAVDALYVFIIVQFMRNIPTALIDAARVDGCTNWQIYSRIVMPLATPALVTVALLSFLFAWNDFFSQLVYLNDVERYTIPVGLRLFLDSVGNSDFGALLAMSTTSIAPMLVAFVAFQRYIVEGIATTGIRG
jgi:multiple sugar transport system permease protein